MRPSGGGGGGGGGPSSDRTWQAGRDIHRAGLHAVAAAAMSSSSYYRYICVCIRVPRAPDSRVPMLGADVDEGDRELKDARLCSGSHFRFGFCDGLSL